MTALENKLRNEDANQTIAFLDVDGSWQALLTNLWKESGATRLVWLSGTAGDIMISAVVDADGVRFFDDRPSSNDDGLSLETARHVLEQGVRLESEGTVWLPVRFEDRLRGCLVHQGVTSPEGCRELSDPEVASRLEGLLRTLSMARNCRHQARSLAEYRKSEGLLRENLEQTEAMVRNREEALEAAQRELVRKERLATLGQLIATVSHELRNPLGTVRGSVFLISQRLLGKDLGVERALDRAERNIVRCDRIIEDLLDYTRTRDLELQPAHLDRWLENALEEYLFPADLVVRVQLGAPDEVLIEPERLRRCLVNLLNNACDAMKTKKGEVSTRPKELVVSSHRLEDRVEIRVRDTGCGIPSENLEKIFEPLVSTKSFGVGLGLPTVHQIMEQHRGGLGIESEEGAGTTAVLWLPIYEKTGESRN